MARTALPDRQSLLASALLCVALTLAGQAIANERYEGHAYSRSGGTLLYRETHWRYRQDGLPRRLVLYQCPDGTPFARKNVLESPSPTAPDFDFVDARDGYREGVRTHQGEREVYVREGSGSPLNSSQLTVPADAVIDAGFDAMVRARWAALASGESIRLPFLLPSRFGFMPVKLTASEGETIGEVPVRRLRMTVDRWFGFFVPPIEITYSLQDRRLLEFAGIATIRNAKGKHQDVRIVFPENLANAKATMREIEQALARPLARQCAA